MDYRDDEYLKLFKQIKEQDQQIETKNYSLEQLRGNNVNSFNYQMIKETPTYEKGTNYTNYKQPFESNINEVVRTNYSKDLNLNDFNIETKVNGQNLNEVYKQNKQQKEDKLNEIMELKRQERLNEIKRTQEVQEIQSLNETVNFKDTDVVTLEMFQKARVNSMMIIAKRILPK